MRLDIYEEESAGLPRPRKNTDPVSKYDYALIMARTIGKPIGYVLGKTKGWPAQWFLEMYSELKSIREPISKAKYVNWFLRESKPK